MLTVAAVAVFSTCVVGSLACSCWHEAGPDRYCRYPVVVRGVATAEWEERPEPLDHSDPWSKYFMNSDWVYTVQVEEAIILPDSLQGNATIELRSPTQGSLCGRRFPVDVSIVFFAWLRDGGQVETGLCEPNSPWEDLDDWERELITEHIPDYCANKDSNRKPPEP